MVKFTSNIEPSSPPLSLCFLWIPFKTFPSHILHSACIVTSHGFFSMDKYHQWLTGSIRWVIKFSFVLIKFVLCFIHFRTSWTKVFGTKYCKGQLCHHCWDTSCHSVFVLDGREVLLNYTALRVIEFECHLNAYKVERRNETNIIKQTDLEDFHPLGMCNGHGCYSDQFYIVLKYNVDCLQ